MIYTLHIADKDISHTIKQSQIIHRKIQFEEEKNKKESGMEGKFGLIVCVVLMFMLAGKNVAQTDTTTNTMAVGVAEKLFTCLGGCYNQCFLLQTDSGATFPCYYKCLLGLGTCITTPTPTAPTPLTAPSFPYSCHIGCSSQNCLPLASDDADMQTCLGDCGKACGTD